MSGDLATPAGSGWSEARPVDIDGIERELEGLLRSPQAEGEPVVSRACMSNLMVFARGADQAAEVASEIAAIAEHHPSRVLLLVDEPGSDPGPHAWVSTLCHLGEGGRRICSEQVSIRAGGEALRRLPSIARPLLVGDLPTALWWAAAMPPPLGGDLFFELAAMARRVIWDSAAWEQEAQGLACVGDWAGGVDPAIGLSDLAWVRLAPWRSMVAGLLGGSAAELRTVRIEHGPHALPKALLFVGWLASRLGWRPWAPGRVGGDAARWEFTSTSGSISVEVCRIAEAAPAIVAVILGTVVGGIGREVVVRRSVDGRLVRDLAAPGMGSTVSGPSSSRGSLVSRELPDLDGDPLYRAALPFARAMATDVVR